MTRSLAAAAADLAAALFPGCRSFATRGEAPARDRPSGQTAHRADEEAACGWFDSSHDLTAGLSVREQLSAADVLDIAARGLVDAATLGDMLFTWLELPAGHDRGFLLAAPGGPA